MSVPLRKDQPEEELTTADLAQGNHPPASEELRPILSEPIGMERSERSSPVEMEKADKGSLIEMEREEKVASGGRNRDDATPLFPNNELEELRNRWNTVQAAFVDEPRHAVEQADSLVASAMKRLAEVFAEERIGAITSRRRICASRSSATVHSFTGCWRSSTRPLRASTRKNQRGTGIQPVPFYPNNRHQNAQTLQTATVFSCRGRPETTLGSGANPLSTQRFRFRFESQSRQSYTRPSWLSTCRAHKGMRRPLHTRCLKGGTGRCAILFSRFCIPRCLF